MKYHVLCAALILSVVVSIGIHRQTIHHRLCGFRRMGKRTGSLPCRPGPNRGGFVTPARHTHLLIRYDLFDRWLSTLTDNDKETMARFFQTRTRLLFSSGGHGLFALEE